MAICYTSQFNSAQANQYFVLTQRDGEPVRLQGNAFGDLVTDTTTPLFLKPGGDESCSMDSVATIASSGTFDLSEVRPEGGGGERPGHITAPFLFERGNQGGVTV